MQKQQPGLVIARYGQTAEIETKDGQIIPCHLRKNQAPVVTGDRVTWSLLNNEQGVIHQREPRHTELGRVNARGEKKPIAANIDIMFIIVAPEPVLDEYLIDCYLATAEQLAIIPVLVFNKIDLLDQQQLAAFIKRLDIYKTMGYQVIYLSTLKHTGFAKLEPYFKEKTSILVGQSGTGKSSIIKTLLPDYASTITTGDISQAIKQGKHTTTVTRLYHSPMGGDIIDSPGVREFMLEHIDATHIMQGFIEFRPYLGQCKFRNCQHLKEPNCAIQAALKQGKISTQRFNNYHKMLTELTKS